MGTRGGMQFKDVRRNLHNNSQAACVFNLTDDRVIEFVIEL